MTLQRVMLLMIGVMAASACGSGIPSNIALIVENRTNTPLALTSELRVEPCSEGTFTRDDVLMARQAQRIVTWLDPGDVPPAALVIPDDVAREATAGWPVIAIVTSAGTQFSTGALDRSTLPACAGTAPGN